MAWLLSILVLCLLSTYAQVSMLHALSSRQLPVVSVTISMPVPESESVKTYKEEYRNHDNGHDSSEASKGPLYSAASASLAQ